MAKRGRPRKEPVNCGSSEETSIAATISDIRAKRPKVSNGHFVLLKWPGPGSVKELDGLELRHCYPTAKVSVPEKHLAAFLKHGFEFVDWARP